MVCVCVRVCGVWWWRGVGVCVEGCVGVGVGVWCCVLRGVWVCVCVCEVWCGLWGVVVCVEAGAWVCVEGVCGGVGV